MYEYEVKIITAFEDAGEQFVKFKRVKDGEVFTLSQDGFIKRFGVEILKYFCNRKNIEEVVC